MAVQFGALVPLTKIGPIQGMYASWAARPMLEAGVRRRLESGLTLSLGGFATIGSRFTFLADDPVFDEAPPSRHRWLAGEGGTIGGFLGGVGVRIRDTSVATVTAGVDIGAIVFGAPFPGSECDPFEPWCSATTELARSVTAPTGRLSADAVFLVAGVRTVVRLGDVISLYPPRRDGSDRQLHHALLLSAGLVLQF